MKNPLKALEAVERLVGGGLGMELEWYLYKPEVIKRKEDLHRMLKLASKVITEIYCIVHAENSHTCRHEAWEKIKYEILAKPEE